MRLALRPVIVVRVRDVSVAALRLAAGTALLCLPCLGVEVCDEALDASEWLVAGAAER
jgi:hypothetical protein